MINFFKKLKVKKLNRGMTYVELIVVLSIFAMISSVVMFNYGDFQSKVDMKNLAGDVGLKVVEAQRSSLSGLLPYRGSNPGWKPSYGLYFNLQDKGGQSQFVYFADLNENTEYDTDSETELLNTIELTKNSYIYRIEAFYKGDDGSPIELEDITITYSRPSSGAVFKTSNPKIEYGMISHVDITIGSIKDVYSKVKIYSSGRIQLE